MAGVVVTDGAELILPILPVNDLKRRTVVVVPAYNVARYIGKVIDGCLKHFSPEKVLVVDDGSTDGTGEVAREKGVQVITHPRNQGKGSALLTGLKRASDLGMEWVLTLDGDLQHNPADMEKFILAASQGKYDLIIGARDRRAGVMPWDRRFSNWCTTALLSLASGVPLKDVQCGYRMIRLRAIAGAYFRTRRYDFETEVLAQCLRQGGQVGWVPIEAQYAGEPSHIHRFLDTVRFIRVFLLNLAGLVVARYRRRMGGGIGV